MKNDGSFEYSIEKYYREKIIRYGANAKGVDWNDASSQKLRFEIQLKVANPYLFEGCRILDFGCGYGEFIDSLRVLNLNFVYTGYDLVKLSLEQGRLRYGELEKLNFVEILHPDMEFDFLFASGVFNVFFGNLNEWLYDHVKNTLKIMSSHSQYLILNFLKPNPSRHSTKLFFPSVEQIKDILPEKCRILEVCDNYNLWEWTVLIERS